MFEKEAEEIANKKLCSERICYNHCNFNSPKHHRCGEWHRIYDCAKESAEFGYNKVNEWHYVKDGDLPRQYGHTCFSIDVLANNKKWVYYEFSSGKWFCGNKEVKVIAWKEIELPALPKEIKK